MIDGQTIALRSSGENFLGIEAVPLLLVERIEIIRVPGSVLYGANAFLGVINIITKEGYQVEGGVVQVGYEGGPNQTSPYQSAFMGFDNGKWAGLASAAHESQRRFGYRTEPLPGREPRGGKQRNSARNGGEMRDKSRHKRTVRLSVTGLKRRCRSPISVFQPHNSFRLDGGRILSNEPWA